MIRRKLLALSALQPILYNNFIQDDAINDKINNFVDLEKSIIPDDLKSNAYDEVALATIDEQEV
jgi:hypothetical protein